MSGMGSQLSVPGLTDVLSTGNLGMGPNLENDILLRLLNDENEFKNRLKGLNSNDAASLPNIEYDTWLAKEIIPGFLYWGDNIDALNFGHCIENEIEYFINCAAGMCLILFWDFFAVLVLYPFCLFFKLYVLIFFVLA